MLILDRMENGIAYISTEDGQICADCRLLSGEIAEGDVLAAEDGLYVRDEAATQARREHIRILLYKRLNLKK